MAKNQKRNRKESANGKAVNEKDPTIRQEFPGAETSKKKIEAGIRNVKSKAPGGPGNNPPINEEPVDEQSENLKT